jgi:hypothetical protein
MKSLEGKKLGAYTLTIRFKAMRIHGHLDLFVYLNDKNGIKSREPCIRGLYSKGRSDSSYHFLDARFFPLIHFENSPVNLIDENLADGLFELIGTIIRPGGQLYLSYHNDELFFREMNKAFRNSIPPIATTLGQFLVISGCVRVKSFYGAEGRFRIEGEKPKDTKTAVKWANEMLNDIIDCLIKKVMNSTSPSLPKQRDQAIHYPFICTKPHVEC